MKTSHKTVSPVILVLIVVFSPAITYLHAQDWPQWRGVDRKGVLATTGLLEKFDKLTTQWKRPISGGYCGPTVADGRVYVMDRVAKPTQMERIHCFDEKSGQPLWSHSYDCTYTGVGYVAGPRASVTIEDGRAYAIGTMGNAHCFDARTGDVLWKKDFNADYKITDSKRMPIWGIASSPLVYDNLVIYHIGAKNACVIALDKLSGKVVWESLKDRGQYSAPVLVQQNGNDVIVVWTGDSVAGLNPKSGEPHWRYEFTPINMPIGIATPIVSDQMIFCTSFYDGALMLKMKPDSMDVEEVWSARGDNERVTQALHSIISTPIWIEDHIYGVDSYGELRCLEARTGRRVWESLEAVPKARWSTIHFVRSGPTGNRVWMFTERGDLVLGELTPEGYTEISRAHIIEPTKPQLNRRGGVCWSHPAWANGSIVVRSDRFIKRISLKIQE